MSYYYRPRRYRSRNRSRARAQSQTPQTQQIFNVETYLKNEFFSADTVTLGSIIGLYRDLYGDGAYRYLIQTYSSWKVGSVRVSGQTSTRILQCVPRFLSDEKRFFVLKCEVIHFIERLHRKQLNKHTSLTQLNNAFQNYAKEIDNFTGINLPWFLKDGIFEDSEIRELIAVCKYALREKLRLSYRQALNDLILIKDRLSSLKPGSFSATYRIDFLNSSVDVSGISNSSLQPVELRSTTANVSGRFQRYAEQYIIEELTKMRFSEQQGQVNRFIKSQDISFFLTQYYEILNRQEEASLNSTFQGEGGQLTLALRAMSMRVINAQILASSIRLGLYVALLLIAVALVLYFKLYGIVCALFWIAIIVGGFFIGALQTEIKALLALKEDWKKHGQ